LTQSSQLGQNFTIPRWQLASALRCDHRPELLVGDWDRAVRAQIRDAAGGRKVTLKVRGIRRFFAVVTQDSRHQAGGILARLERAII